jgi:fermentation-respiration switch protein FrsA (DUF1100 family)
MRRRLAKLLVTLFVGYIVAVALLWALQRKILYVAQGKTDVALPPSAHLIEVKASDGVVVRAVDLAAETRDKVVVYFHGNGEVIGDDVWIARELVRRGLGVVLVEYRGYGHSSPGSPTEAGLYADAEAVLADLARRGVDASRVVLWGASLGTGIAVEMAVRGRGAALVLVSPYTSMVDVGAFHIPWAPVSLLLEDRYDTITKAPRVTLPALVLHGRDDEVVPFSMGEAVARAIAGARFVPIDGGHHNDLFQGSGVGRFDDVVAFVREAGRK